ncbi:MAG: D-alanyl-D-alanine carboxypeptidase/D-alanyl-D-alanine-endopeptidase [Pseudomonadota bacterium]
MSKSKNRSAAQFFGVPLICVSTMVALFASIAPQALAGDQLPPVIERAMQRFDFDPDGLSVMVQNVETGDVLLDYQAHVPRNPASTMKLLTTYASLDTLTPGHLWNTKVYTFGDIDANGVLHGDLAIRGGGDPFFVEETLWKMLMELRRRGLRSITGDLLLDNSLFDLDREDPAAFDGEPLRAYNVAPDALLFNLKVVRFWFEPDADSRSVKVSSLPRLPNLEIVNDLKLVPGRCRGYMRGIEIDAEPNGNRVRFHGRFPDGCRRYSFGRTLLDHDSYAYGLFRSLWESLGGTLEGGYRRVVVDDSQKPLMSWQSRSYGELIRLINKHSNNVMTRQVFLTLGSHYFGEPASLTKARDAVRVWLDEQRIDFDSLVIDNGSGLSRDARMSARELTELLRHAWRSPFMPEFISSLSLAGTDGTVSRRHKRGELTGRAHLKTGRLDDVTALAGYLLADDGTRYALAILHNDKGVHRGGGEAVQDALLRWLYNYQTPIQAQSDQAGRVLAAE